MSDSAIELTRDDVEAMMVLLADVRDDVIEASKTLAQTTRNAPEAEIVQQLHDVIALLERQHTLPLRGWYGWLCALLLGGVLGSGLSWYATGCDQHTQAQAQLMGQVDALLRVRYTSLPPALQDALQALYTRAGFQPIGQRKP
jgi:hypothetical protein